MIGGDELTTGDNAGHKRVAAALEESDSLRAITDIDCGIKNWWPRYVIRTV
jgi:hypothetical protein